MTITQAKMKMATEETVEVVAVAVETKKEDEEVRVYPSVIVC